MTDRPLPPCAGAPAFLFYGHDDDDCPPPPPVCETCPRVHSLPCTIQGMTEEYGCWGGFTVEQRVEAKIQGLTGEQLWLTKPDR